VTSTPCLINGLLLFGHRFGPGGVVVGHQACLGHGGAHTTWTCRTCDETVFGPPLNTHCSTLNGPATVRISNHAETYSKESPRVMDGS
jgi:hypothetical protein